jgi:hypothetical protein
VFGALFQVCNGQRFINIGSQIADSQLMIVFGIAPVSLQQFLIHAHSGFVIAIVEVLFRLSGIEELPSTIWGNEHE